MKKKTFAVAIDGPSGAGKSTISRACAAELGLIYVDTGAIYRTVGLAAARAGVASRDAAGVEALLPALHIDITYDDSGAQCMVLNGENVSALIRTPEISLYASDVSAIPAVRAYLLEMQREMARRHSVIMDGRDIGTVVLPEADLKIFLTASDEDRARRRMKELEEKGTPCPFDRVLADLRYRDAQDSSRAAAPLKAAEDAVLVDTTGNSFVQSRDLILALIRERMGR